MLAKLGYDSFMDRLNSATVAALTLALGVLVLLGLVPSAAVAQINGMSTQWGIGDVEIGAKYRFLPADEMDWWPQAAFYHQQMKEFLLMYDDVRAAASPKAALMEFLQSTYDAAADLGKWDRKALERPSRA